MNFDVSTVAGLPSPRSDKLKAETLIRERDSLLRRLDDQEGPKVVRTGVKRISGRVMKSRGKMLLKLAVQWGLGRDILPRVFLPPAVAAVDNLVGSSAVCGDDFCEEGW